MAASEMAYGEGHPATFDTYKNEAGKMVTRQMIQVPERVQLSGEAFGDASVEEKSFARPEPAPELQDRDFGPDS